MPTMIRLLDVDVTASLDASLTFGQCHQVGRGGPFWMETIKHTGVSPFLNDSSYAVFRNVKDFGAKGDGKTDDTAAIQAAIDGTCLYPPNAWEDQNLF
jgi:hypothetical protein